MDVMDQKIEDHKFVASGVQSNTDLMNNARSNFVQKVYSILGVQMSVTAFFVALSTFNESFQKFQQQNMGLFYVALVISFVTIIALFCCRGLATKSPINGILLSVFKICESYMVSMICSFYTPQSVLNAAVTTLAVTVGLTLYAIYTKTDYSDNYSKCYGFFWAFFCVIFSLTLLNIFFIQSEALSIVIAAVIGAIYCFYLIIDTQLIMGGRNQELTLDNYILGAVMLYIDIIQIFLSILRIVGDRN